MNSAYLICKKCWSEKKSMRPEVLGRLEDGNLYVKRHSNEVTIIESNDYKVKCGRCGSQVHIERRENESSDIREFWIHRIAFTGSSVSQKLERGTSYAGTSLLS